MGDHDAAVAWVRERFNDPTHYFDAHVLEHIERDPGFAEVVREMITRPASRLRYRVYISEPNDPELATEQARERLNARLRLVGVQAVPHEGEQLARRGGGMWTVRLPQSHEEYVRFLLTGPYGFSGAPDGEALIDEAMELSLSQLEAVRRCLGETREYVQAGLARLQEEELPETSATPSDMLRYLVHVTGQYIGGTLSQLEFMDGILAREQQRRGSTPPDRGPAPQ